jgi:hypothetical protein
MLKNPAPTPEIATQIFWKHAYKFFKILEIAYGKDTERIAKLMQRMHDFYNENSKKINNKIKYIATRMLKEKNLISQKNPTTIYTEQNNDNDN